MNAKRRGFLPRLFYFKPEGEQVTAGDIVFDWKGKDQYNKAVSSGVYYYHLDGGGPSISGKMLLIK